MKYHALLVIFEKASSAANSRPHFMGKMLLSEWANVRIKFGTLAII